MIQEHIERSAARLKAAREYFNDFDSALRALDRELDVSYTDLKKNTARATQIADDLRSGVLPSLSSPKQRQFVLAAIDFLTSYRSL